MSSPIPPGIIGHNRAWLTPHYAVFPPAGIMDSLLPGLQGCILRFMTSPAMGARFSQAMLLVAPGGGTTAPIDNNLQHFLYVLSGTLELGTGKKKQVLVPGGFAYLPAGSKLAFRNSGDGEAQALWVKRPYTAVEGIAPPQGEVRPS